MPTWDRFDICEAYCVIEWDYNLGGWLRERPTNYRRQRSTAVQLFRMKFKPRSDLNYETLTDNGKKIYDMLVQRYELPK